MKIFLDLEKKTVQIIDLIGFDELEELKRFLGADYKEWKIEPTADAPAQSQPIGVPNFPSQPYQPFQPFQQPYNPFPIITYGPANTIIGTGTAVGGFGGTTGVTTGNCSTSIGYATSYTNTGNLSVFSHADDENKILVAGDFSNTNLNKILQDKERQS